MIAAVLVGMALYPPARPLVMPSSCCAAGDRPGRGRTGIGVVARLSAQLVVGAGVPGRPGAPRSGAGRTGAGGDRLRGLAGRVCERVQLHGRRQRRYLGVVRAILAGVVYAVIGVREDLPLLDRRGDPGRASARLHLLPWNAGRRAKIFLGDVGSVRARGGHWPDWPPTHASCVAGVAIEALRLAAALYLDTRFRPCCAGCAEARTGFVHIGRTCIGRADVGWSRTPGWRWSAPAWPP